MRGAFLHELFGFHSFEGLSGRVRMEVHRVCELGRLLELWEQARRGQGSVVLVSGEAGIGKSRLLEALCERAAESSFLIRVQCWSRFSTHALPPVIELTSTVRPTPTTSITPR